MDLVHLTRKQHEFFDYIVEYKKEYDITKEGIFSQR